MKTMTLFLALLFLVYNASAQRADNLQRIGGIIGGVTKSAQGDWICLGVYEPKFRIDQILTNGFISTRMYWFGRDYDMSKEILAFIECDSSKLCLKDKWGQKVIECGITNINKEQMHYLKAIPEDKTSLTNKTISITNQVQKTTPPKFLGMKNTDTFSKHKKLGQ